MAHTRAAGKFQFNLVSPEEPIMAEPVWKATIPASEGEIGVLPLHSSLVTTLNAGVVNVYREKGADKEAVFISGGFADVTPESCTVLAEEAVPVRSLDKSDLEQTIRNLQEDISLAEGEADKAYMRKKLDMARAKLDAVTSAG